MIFQSLWIGDRLSRMESLSINSFLANGHEYHLYTFEKIKTPPGTIVKNASDILPESKVFKYSGELSKGGGSYSGFSNYFRFKLLINGGWWVDTDVVCLREIDVNEPYVFVEEPHPAINNYVSSCLLKMPPQSEIAKYLWNQCESKDAQNIKWGETGPSLVTDGVNKFCLNEFVKSYKLFCPIKWTESEKIIENTSIPKESYTLHMWNEMWRRKGIDKNKTHSFDSLFERLYKKYVTYRQPTMF